MKVGHVVVTLDIDVEVEDDFDPDDLADHAFDVAQMNGWKDYVTDVSVGDLEPAEE